MAKVYYEKDADLNVLKGKTIAIIGYGSQGHAHALNLHDSGLNVIVGLPASSASRAKAAAAKLEVFDPAEAARRGDVIVMLIPDHIQQKVYKESIAPNLGSGKTLLFAHGFSIHFKSVVPPPEVDVVMIAPKSPGHRMRELFTEGVGVPALLAVEQDASGHAEQTALAYALGVGCLKAGVIRTTFKEETETDLFGEQTVLCGGVSALIAAGFETLVSAGYQPEIAYFECLHELKLIVDLIYQGGIKYMRYSVSDTAEYGDYTRGPAVIDQHVRESMKKVLADVQSGAFAQEWIKENNEGGRKNFLAMRAKEQNQLIEKVGVELRKMMAWNQPAEEATAAQAQARR
ncbi:MAG: ketol-acid reductoisomerase [Acidobacteriota bacterium]|nr:ketol-acid reductoisomerase [Acidobacteriota bacterium]